MARALAPGMKRTLRRGRGVGMGSAVSSAFCGVLAGFFPLRQIIAGEQLGDLHRVERGALAQIVGDDPQIQAVRHGRIAADAADIDRVLARGFDRRDIAFIGAVIDDDDARRLASAPRAPRPR